MANFYVDLPDELEDDNNVNISNLHRSVTHLIKTLNYTLGNIDSDNMTEEVADIINKLAEGDNTDA